jgi:RNA polymerase-interacting CarD/CdnL/TRCF family regulator
MLQPPDDRTAVAIRHLSHDDDWKRVLGWLQANRDDISQRLESEQNEAAFRRLQGCALVLRDLLRQVQ